MEMEILEVICITAVLGIVCFAGYQIYAAVDKKKKEHRNRVESIKKAFNDQKGGFDGTLASFFNTKYSSYENTYINLKNVVSRLESTNRELRNESKNDDYSSTISSCSKLAEDFNAFGQRVKRLPYTRMMDASNYGQIQKSYWESVRSMDKRTADTIIANCERNISGCNYSQIFATDVEAILRCVWFYATDKPYSAESFKKAVDVFSRFAESAHVDVTIAELYAMKQMGGEDVLRDRIRNMLGTNSTAEELTIIASALMWINAYQVENILLQHMLSKGMQMSAKTQERLHSLTNGGGKAPNGFEVVSSGSAMYFDVSALAWKDDDYTGLFENLAFQEKTLSYSLAVRDEDKDLFITSGINVPDMPAILSKLNSVFADEYGNAVTAAMKKCIALSGSGEENIEGILAESNECRQMGILVHVARIGKKLNIKFYTLFMPGGTRLADQKQQVLSLYKKLSPSVAMWESSIKDTVLMAIQQLLNAEPQITSGGGTASSNEDGPIF